MPKVKLFFLTILVVFVLSILVMPGVALAAQCCCDNDYGPVDSSDCATTCANQPPHNDASKVKPRACPSNPGKGNGTATPNTPVEISDPINIYGKGPQVLYARIIEALLAFVGVASLVSFVYAGFTFIFSAGNQERVKKAKDTMVYAVVGVFVAMSSYAVLSWIFEVLERGTGN